MNKKGFGPIPVLASWMLFLVIWLYWLNDVINYYTAFWIETHGITGIEAFLLAQLNMLIFLISIIGVFIGVVSSS